MITVRRRNPDVKLHLPCNGPDASTSILDFSARHRSPTVNGNAQLDTAFSKFGPSALLLDGSGDYLSYADSDDWDLPGDFYLAAWIRMPSIQSSVQHYTIMSRINPEASGEWSFQVLAAPDRYLNFRSGATDRAQSTSQLANNTTYHVAVSRVGSTVRLFINGTQDGSGTFATALNSSQPLQLGYRNSGYNAYFGGWMDDVVFIKGAGVSASFTAPTQGFRA